MTKELFTIVMDCIKSVPIDEWEIEQNPNTKYSCVKYKTILIDNDGDIKISGDWQSFSWFQSRKVNKLFHNIKEEMATRAIQRLCDKA